MKPSDDPYFRVQQEVVTTSEGPVGLPILYSDVTNVVALFDAPIACAERVLAGTGLEPMVARGHAVVALSFYEYRASTVGVYNEVGTAIFVTRHGERKPRLGWADLMVPPRWRTIGAYVVDLPVTTRAANAAGREIWGYPKFVTEIPFRSAGREFDASVADPKGGSPIVRLAGRMGLGLPAPPLSLVTYTQLKGALVRTQVDVRGAVTIHGPGSLRLETSNSDHPMACQSRLHEGTIVRRAQIQLAPLTSSLHGTDLRL